jgi:hypothetical protein
MNSRKMKFPGRAWRRTVVLAAALCSMGAGHAWTAEPQWPAGPYNYFVVDQDVRAVLEQFGRNLNIPMRVSESVEAKRLKGKLNAASPREFLQWICDSYGLTWYFDGAVLHIFARSELRNVYLDLGAVPLDDLNQLLAKAGIADERFTIRATAEPHLISVVGPPVYTALVRQMLNALRETARAPAPQPEPAAATGKDRPAAPAPQQSPEPPKRIKQASPLEKAGAPPQSPVNAPIIPVPSQAGRPTAWQNMGIELRFMSVEEKKNVEEKKRLTRMLQRPGEDARGNENTGIMVFRGGRR